MRFRFRHISILIALTICFSVGCSKSENDERLEKDNALIERELKSKKINFTKHNNVYHAIQKKGYGYMVAPGDSVAFWYVGYILVREILFSIPMFPKSRSKRGSIPRLSPLTPLLS